MKKFWRRETWFKTAINERFRAQSDIILRLQERIKSLESAAEELKRMDDWLLRLDGQIDREMMGRFNLTDISSLVRAICDHLGIKPVPPDRMGWTVRPIPPPTKAKKVRP